MVKQPTPTFTPGRFFSACNRFFVGQIEGSHQLKKKVDWFNNFGDILFTDGHMDGPTEAK